MAKRVRRRFEPQFKAEVVLAILSGAQTQAEVCRHHGLKPELVSLWKKTFLARLPLLFDGAPADTAAQARVAELERLVGRLTLELEVAKKVSALLPSVLGSGGRS
jgi:transposase-like protein